MITKLESLKMLQQKIGMKIDGPSNIYIDRKNTFQLATSNAIYPCIVKIVNGKAIDHQFQSPKNSGAFEQLKMKTGL